MVGGISSASADPGGFAPSELQEPSPDGIADTADSFRLGEFSSLWDTCRVSVRAYLTSLLSNKSDIDDCIQEVALIAWKKGPLAAGDSAFLGHCLATARLVGLAAIRKNGRSRVCFLPPDVALSLADEVMRQELADTAPTDRVLALRACMSRLDDRQRHLLGLRYVDGGHGRLEEMARKEGKSPGAVYKTLERLRTSLRECVSRRMGETGTDSR